MISFPYFHKAGEGHVPTAPRSIEDGGGFTGQIIRTKQPLLHLWETDLAQEYVEASDATIEGSGRMAESYLGVPLIVADEVIGVLSFSSYREVRIFNEEDVRLVMSLVPAISVAVQNTLQFNVANRRAEREALLNHISQKIQSAPTVQSALQTAVSELGQALKLKKAVVELSTTKQNNGHIQE